RNVRVENCIISGRKNAVLIKSREGRGGFMEDITFENIVIQNSPNFLSIDLLTRGIQASEPVMEAAEKWARVRNLIFRNVQVRDVGELVSARNISAEQPVEGLILANITGNCRTGITLVNVKGAKLTDIKVTGYTGELITLSGEKTSLEQ
ncbi:MAG: glycoside hydrolase family 28 protein, partial [Akkermansiaceae bacterium]|nr:glycoside hydrolase family 28 protein [Verrucomicrobiales bacterium]